uniref:Putative F-box protein PP2-B10-like n=1 Tax=Davidia involucrata TaxID=16924 RepID=A0A5B6Z146_DAVIN
MGMEISNARPPVVDFSILPEGCIANVLSLTSPRDACRLSLVASSFRSAAESDAVWERFLPSDYHDILARARDSPPSVSFSSKKELYLGLCDQPLIIDKGTKSFWLEKWSGKKCYMLAARDLTIVWGDTPMYWRWISLPECSTNGEVAELIRVCWLEIRGNISTRLLSLETSYAAYLVFRSSTGTYGFEYQPAEGWVGISGDEGETRTVYLDPEEGGEQRHGYQHPIIPRRIGMFSNNIMLRQPRESSGQYPKMRGDGWMEIELGEYFSRGGEDGELGMSLMEVKGGDWKSGLIVQGIEIRPKEEGKIEIYSVGCS